MIYRDEIGPFFLHEETQEITRIADWRRKYFARGQVFDVRDTISEFLQDEGVTRCIVLMWCQSRQTKGKREVVTMLAGNEVHKFWTVENIDGRWKHNEIEGITPEAPYLLYLERNPAADNGCLVMAKTPFVITKRVKT